MAATATTTATASSLATFVPRATFPRLTSLPRSYFLGHHKAGLDKMKTLLSQIDLVVECRDYRIPLTSRNPLLEEGLAGKQRMIVYTKRDLGVTPGRERLAQHHDTTIRTWHAPTPVHFSATASPNTTASLLTAFARFAAARHSLTGHRVLVAGMPNVGKSTLLNALRAVGVHKGKAAKTGGQPGVTRRVGTGVKVLKGEAVDAAGAGSEGASSEGVYVLDTPGVFMPYVPDGEAMLKLALCGCVKDNVVPLYTLADYMLFRINLVDPGLYSRWAAPTNDVGEVLRGVAGATGRLGKGGVLDLEGAAAWLVQRWRAGELGRFVLDEVGEGALERARREEETMGVSVNQARKLETEARRARSKERGLRKKGALV